MNESQLDLFSVAPDQYELLKPFLFDQLVPAGWDWALGPKKGDLVEMLVCPDCGGLEVNACHLALNHGWQPGIPDQTPCSWARHTPLKMCQFQWRRMGFHAGLEAGKLPQRRPGLWGWAGGKYQRLWTPRKGWLIGHGFHHDGPPGAIWRFKPRWVQPLNGDGYYTYDHARCAA